MAAWVTAAVRVAPSCGGGLSRGGVSCIKTRLIGFPLLTCFSDVGQGPRRSALRAPAALGRTLPPQASAAKPYAAPEASGLLPPRGLALTLPVSSCSSAQRTADDALTR